LFRFPNARNPGRTKRRSKNASFPFEDFRPNSNETNAPNPQNIRRCAVLPKSLKIAPALSQIPNRSAKRFCAKPYSL